MPNPAIECTLIKINAMLSPSRRFISDGSVLAETPPNCSEIENPHTSRKRPLTILFFTDSSFAKMSREREREEKGERKHDSLVRSNATDIIEFSAAQWQDELCIPVSNTPARLEWTGIRLSTGFFGRVSVNRRQWKQ